MFGFREAKYCYICYYATNIDQGWAKDIIEGDPDSKPIGVFTPEKPKGAINGGGSSIT